MRARVDDLLRYERLSDITASPLGPRVACTVETPDPHGDCYRSAIWVFDCDTGDAQALTAGVALDHGSRWSPDGGTLAFLSSRTGSPQLHTMPLSGGEARQLGNFDAGVVDFSWSPDGTRLGVIAAVENRPAAITGNVQAAVDGRVELVTRLPYKRDGLGYTLTASAHLYVVDAHTGASRQLTCGDFEVQALDWSPDGRQIYISRTRAASRRAHRTDIWSVDTATGASRQLTDEVGMAQAPRCAPDGSHLAFSGSRQDGDAQVRLWLYAMASGEVRGLGGDHIEVVDGGSLKWDAGSQGITFLSARRGLQEVAHVAIGDGDYRTATGGNWHISGFASLPGGGMALIAESPERPNQLFVQHGDGAPRQLSHLNQWWCHAAAPNAVLRQFNVPDGNGGTESVDGWVMTPPIPQGSAPRPGPLLIDVHGGPASYVLLAYTAHPYWQVLVDAGWTILALNPVGSSSYGREFADRLRGRWGDLDLAQHLAAASTLEAEGQSDGRRAITGKSYGGYAAAWAITQNQCFRAAVVCAPLTDLETHYGSSDSGYYADDYEMQGTPSVGDSDENRGAYSRNSPARYAGRVVTPTLLLQGKEDQRCPLPQAEDFFVRILAKSDTPAEMALYPGGSHHVFETGLPSQRVDAVTRMVSWLAHWIEREIAPPARAEEERAGKAE